MHSGIAGYPSTGISRVLTSVVFSLGVKLLHLLSWLEIPLPLFTGLVMWAVKPFEVIFRPSNLPSLKVSIFLQLTVIFVSLI